jgi:hypothetical protein
VEGSVKHAHLQNEQGRSQQQNNAPPVTAAVGAQCESRHKLARSTHQVTDQLRC